MEKVKGNVLGSTVCKVISEIEVQFLALFKVTFHLPENPVTVSRGQATGYLLLKAKVEDIPMKSLHTAAQISQTRCRFKGLADGGDFLIPFL